MKILQDWDDDPYFPEWVKKEAKEVFRRMIKEILDLKESNNLKKDKVNESLKNCIIGFNNLNIRFRIDTFTRESIMKCYHNLLIELGIKDKDDIEEDEMAGLWREW